MAILAAKWNFERSLIFKLVNMKKDIQFNDYIESNDKFENLIEKYLHISGIGRKFKLIKGNVEGKAVSLIEVRDPLSTTKLIGNIARILSYIFFPIPITALVIRNYQRSHKKINLAFFQDDLLKKKVYQDLTNETINAPLFSTKTLPNKLCYHLVSLTDNLTYLNYKRLVGLMEKYPEIAPETIKKFVTLLTKHTLVKGYEIHLMTLKFLQDDTSNSIIPVSDRNKLELEIKEFLKKEIKTKDKKQIINNFLLAIYPANSNQINIDKEHIDKEQPFVNEFSSLIWNLDPQFWTQNKNSIQEIANSKPSLFLSSTAIENATIYLNFINSQEISAR